MVLWERLINRQWQNSEILRRLLIVKAPHGLYPCITISRETGSGGQLVARKVAKALKLPCYDKEIVELVAKTAHKKRELIAALDERSQDAITNIVNSFLGFESLPERTYIKSLSRVILGIAACQPAVIIGRGANFIVPKEVNLRVRIIAPFRTRLENSMRYEDKDEAQARADLERVHENRKEFVKKYFSKNISNANYYDLVLNTKYLSLDQAAQIIIGVFKKRFLKHRS